MADKIIVKSKRIVLYVFLFLSIVSLSSCKNEQEINFNTVDEALNACKDKLASLKKVESMSLENLGGIIAEWVEIQDTIYNKFIVKFDDEIYEEYEDSLSLNIEEKKIAELFVFSDSIRDEILRIALSKPRKIGDVVRLKIDISKKLGRNNKDDDFNSLCNFYEGLNKIEPFGDVGSAIEEYNKLLQTRIDLFDEIALCEFIKREDKCFRTLLDKLPSVPQKQLQDISDLTSVFFQDIVESVQTNNNASISEKKKIQKCIMMRFNRRMIQNAMACLDHIKRGASLDKIQTSSFRWMILQPYFYIENDMLSLITAKQEEQLIRLADSLPDLLMYLDGINSSSIDEGEVKILDASLSEYFLKTFLKSIL